jgi:adenylylsulfate kinase
MRGVIAWFTGLPASGKTTLAKRVRELLARPSILLDSDEVREAIEARGYGTAERDAFYRALGQLARLFAGQGLAVLVAATAVRREYRDRVRAESQRFIEIHVRASPVECEARDFKGLYARAKTGGAPDLPGAEVPYEAPLAPEVVAGGGFDERAAREVAHLLDSDEASATA